MGMQAMVALRRNVWTVEILFSPSVGAFLGESVIANDLAAVPDEHPNDFELSVLSRGRI